MTRPGPTPPELARGLAALAIDATEAQCTKWLQHLAELRRWNRTYNLVAPGELSQLLTRHLFDSLSLHPHVAPGTLLDVGTGAGFPGLPLAILRPDERTVLLDSAGKKVRFLRHVIRATGLDRVEAVHERIERFSGGGEFRTITSRAFSSLVHFAESVRHLAGPETRLLAMKGQVPEDELDALPAWAQVEAVTPLAVPGLEADRHLVSLRLTPDE